MASTMHWHMIFFYYQLHHTPSIIRVLEGVYTCASLQISNEIHLWWCLVESVIKNHQYTNRDGWCLLLVGDVSLLTCTCMSVCTHYSVHVSTYMYTMCTLTYMFRYVLPMTPHPLWQALYPSLLVHWHKICF